MPTLEVIRFSFGRGIFRVGLGRLWGDASCFHMQAGVKSGAFHMLVSRRCHVSSDCTGACSKYMSRSFKLRIHMLLDVRRDHTESKVAHGNGDAKLHAQDQVSLLMALVIAPTASKLLVPELSNPKRHAVHIQVVASVITHPPRLSLQLINDAPPLHLLISRRRF